MSQREKKVATAHHIGNSRVIHYGKLPGESIVQGEGVCKLCLQYLSEAEVKFCLLCDQQKRSRGQDNVSQHHNLINKEMDLQ